MKHILLSMFALSLFTINANAQNVTEPEFVGEAILLTSNNTSTPLEKQIGQSRSVASTGLVLTGIGKYRQQLQIDGCCSNVTTPKNTELKIIIRAVDNNTDPLSIIKIFKFEKKKKYRRAEISSVNNFGAVRSNNLDYIPFTGKKFGKSSYIITINPKEAGEYGLMISNPNALDEKSVVISSFAITE